VACWFGLASRPGVLADEGATSVFTVDDRALRERFQQELESFQNTEGIPRIDPLSSSAPPGFASAIVLPATTKAGNGKPLSSPEIYRRAVQATLIVGHLYQCDKCSKWHSNLAGGVILDPSGIVVTNYHVMKADRAAVFGAMTAGGEVFPIARVLAASEPDDLAIVQLKTGDRRLEFLTIAPGDDAAGTEVRVVSHPDGRFFTYSAGIVARYYFDPAAKAPRMQITADYARGSSGCGVFNPKGELTGIVSSTQSIYYSQDHDQQKNLQMVVKSCIPVASLRKLLHGARQPQP
ncbi:MAG: trypsin-like peptidase domain-containing protein, partial [Verrucomicrobiae bacterium]|nr:trypsin-like peptidase domain-containing protein [Verrucomicrobiae bacterium]